MTSELWKNLSAHKHSHEVAIRLEKAEYSYIKLFQDVKAAKIPGAALCLIVGNMSYGVLVFILACIRDGVSFICMDPASYKRYVKDVPFDICLYSKEASGEVEQSLCGIKDLGWCMSYGKPHPSGRSVPSISGIGFLTSGTTGSSKVVIQEFTSVNRFAMESVKKFGFSRHTRILITSSLMWDLIVIELFSVLVVGGLCVYEDRKLTSNPFLFSKIVKGHGINTLQASQSYIDMVAFFSGHDAGLLGVSTLILTAEPIFSRKNYKSYFPLARFFSAFGSCEMHNVFSEDITFHLDKEELPLGKPWDNVRSINKISIKGSYFLYDISSSTIASSYIKGGELFSVHQPYSCEDIFFEKNGCVYCFGRKSNFTSVDQSIEIFEYKKKLNEVVYSKTPVSFLDVIYLNGCVGTFCASREEKLLVDRAMRELGYTGRTLEFKEESYVLQRIPRNLHGKVDSSAIRLMMNERVS
jgi:hypothetical protein